MKLYRSLILLAALLAAYIFNAESYVTGQHQVTFSFEEENWDQSSYYHQPRTLNVGMSVTGNFTMIKEGLALLNSYRASRFADSGASNRNRRSLSLTAWNTSPTAWNTSNIRGFWIGFWVLLEFDVVLYWQNNNWFTLP